MENDSTELNDIVLLLFFFKTIKKNLIIAAFKYGDCGTPNEASETQNCCCRRVVVSSSVVIPELMINMQTEST